MNKKNIILVLGIFVCMGIFSIYSFYGRSSDIDKVSSDGANNSAHIAKKELKIREAKSSDVSLLADKFDNVADLENALLAGDELAIQEALDAIVACPECLKRMMSILEDPSYDDKFRHYAARALIKSGSKEGIIAVVGAILDAQAQEQYDFKDRLVQELGDVDSIEAADALASIVTGEEYSDLDFSEMPEDLRYAIQKAIRTMTTGQEEVGDLLVQRYENEMEPEARDRLVDISQPYANIYLVAEAYRSGDMETVSKLIGTLDKTGDTHVTEAFLHFAEEKILSVDETAEVMHQWIGLDSNTNMQNLEFLNEYLSNFERNPEGRAVAAYAMSFFKDNNEAKYALQKAYDHEENLPLREHIESALNMIDTKSD